MSKLIEKMLLALGAECGPQAIGEEALRADHNQRKGFLIMETHAIRKVLARTSLVATTTALLVAGTTSAAQAHTATEAIQAGCGSGYSVVSDGQREVRTSAGHIWGYVYLTYNASNGMNCVVTRKTTFHGTPTSTLARLAVQNRGTYQDWASYSHFAAVKAYGRGACVAYWGDIRNESGSINAAGGRWSWGNCG